MIYYHGMRTIAIIGASENRRKFGNKAVRAYLKAGWQVYPVHPIARQIEQLKVYSSVRAIPGPLDRVTMYVTPSVGVTLLREISKKKPKELYLNPGTSNSELLAQARQYGLRVVLHCSILAIGENPHDY